MAIKPLEIEISFEKKTFSSIPCPKVQLRKSGSGKIKEYWPHVMSHSGVHLPENHGSHQTSTLQKKTSQTNNSQAQDGCSLCSPPQPVRGSFARKKNVDKIKPVYSLPKKNAKQSSQSKDSCFLCFPSTTGEVDTSAVCQKPWETNRRL